MSPRATATSPFSDRTNSLGTSPSPLKPPPPPPPPRAADDETTSDPSASSNDAAPVKEEVTPPLTSVRSSFKAYAATNAFFAFLFVTGWPLPQLVATLALYALCLNGVYTTVITTASSAPAASPITSAQTEEVAKHIASAVNAVADLFGRFKAGEPRLCFFAACTAWLVSSFYEMIPSVSPLSAAWVAFALCFPSKELVVPSWLTAALERAQPHAAAVRAEAAALCGAYFSKENLNAVKAKVPASALTAAVVYGPLALLLGWCFLLTWPQKGFSAAMGLLGYKAWASKEANVELHQQSEKAFASVKRGARRMSMAAKNLFSPKGNKQA